MIQKVRVTDKSAFMEHEFTYGKGSTLHYWIAFLIFKVPE